MHNADLIIASSIFAILFIMFVISTLKEFQQMNKNGK